MYGCVTWTDRIKRIALVDDWMTPAQEIVYVREPIDGNAFVFRCSLHRKFRRKSFALLSNVQLHRNIRILEIKLVMIGRCSSRKPLATDVNVSHEERMRRKQICTLPPSPYLTVVFCRTCPHVQTCFHQHFIRCRTLGYHHVPLRGSCRYSVRTS